MDYGLLWEAIGQTLGWCGICVVIIIAAVGVGYLLVEHHNIVIPVIIFGGFLVAIFVSIRDKYRKLKGKR